MKISATHIAKQSPASHKMVASYLLLISLLSMKVGYAQMQPMTTFEYKDKQDLSVRLHGRVKTMAIRSENIEHHRVDSLFYTFDANGLVSEIIEIGQGVDVIERRLRLEKIRHKFQNGKLISKLNEAGDGLDGEIYQYDKDWNMVLEKSYMNGKLITETSSQYDHRNKVKEKIEYLYGGFSDYDERTQKHKTNYLYLVTNYLYDSNGNLVAKTEKDFKKKLTETTQYKYDSSGNLIEEGSCFTKDEKTDCAYKPRFGYKYNFKNQLIKKFQLVQFSPHNTDEYFEYDEHGNQVDSKGFYIYPGKEPIVGYHYKYQYDEFGNKITDQEVVGQYRSLDFERYQTEKMSYDAYQNVTRVEYVSHSGSPIKVVSNRYTYDDTGNWITMEISEGRSHDDLKLKEIVTRKIEYYQ